MASSAGKPKARPDAQSLPEAGATKPHLHNRFHCRLRDAKLTLQQCMTDYVHANALALRASPCHMCPQGQALRKEFARS